jgi:hypothetical protein
MLRSGGHNPTVARQNAAQTVSWQTQVILSRPAQTGQG